MLSEANTAFPFNNSGRLCNAERQAPDLPNNEGAMSITRSRPRRRPSAHSKRIACRSKANAMNLPRRQFLRLAASAMALSTLSCFARAQAYPTRPVRIIVGYAPGGVNDILARLMGQALSERLGQPFVIENRPGAGTNIATEAAVKATGDGYSLLLVSPANAINATLYDKLNFNFIRDIAPIGSVVRNPLVMVANPTVPARTVPELVAYAKANPGRISMASAGLGSGPHVSGELFKMMAGVDLVHVPYRGDGPALTDLLGGQVQVYFAGVAPTLEHIRAGRLRPLGVTTARRSEILPDIATIGEFVPGYEASTLFGFGAPRSTPIEILERLNNAINAALTDPKVKARLTEIAGVVLGGSPADYGKLIADETEKWGKVVKFANIKPE
jgi:tripartite-type tricarboxylate transporter receptor subunit TctC